MILPLCKRLALNLITLWAIVSLAFFIVHFAPGNPYSAEKTVSTEVLESLKEKYDFSYLEYTTGVLHGDLRYSYTYMDRKVEDIIAESLPVSLELGFWAFLLALFSGLFFSFLATLKPHSAKDRTIMLVAMLGIAIPNFVLGPLLQYFFALEWQILPVAGWYEWDNRILPSITLAAMYTAYTARLTRNSILETNKENYIKVAYAKGLSPWRIAWSHTFKNISIPLLNYWGPTTAALLTGTLVIEKMFNIPGLGRHFVDSALQRDYPLALGVLLCYSVLLLLINLITDFLQSKIDTRIPFQ